MRKGEYRNCIICGKEFYIHRYVVKEGNGKYCSHGCHSRSMIGIVSWNKGLKMPFRHKKMKKGFIPKMAFKKGNIPWNKGIEIKQVRDNHNGNWKGDNASKDAIHKWVIERLGKPKFCEGCGNEYDKRYEWANISGEYKRDLSDWIRLCPTCHRRYDDNANKAWITRRSKL